MAKLSIAAAATSVTVNLFIQDSSSSTGAGKTGLVYNTASLTAYYCLPAAAAVAISLVTQTVTGAFSSGGFVEIDASNMPGWYRFDIPNAALASGRFSSIHFKGAANMAPLPLEIELTGWDNLAGTLATAGNAAIADKILGRNLNGGADGTRTVQDALRALRNRTAISSGTLTVYKEDDSTAAWTGAVTTTAGDPISQIDPA